MKEPLSWNIYKRDTGSVFSPWVYVYIPGFRGTWDTKEGAEEETKKLRRKYGKEREYKIEQEYMREE